MSHFRVVVLLDPETEAHAISDELDRLLARYDERVEVAPYKVYMQHEMESVAHGRESGYCSFCSMAEHYGIDLSDLSGLAHHMIGWMGSPGGVDEQGLFYWTTYNPESKWDWWVIGGRYDGWLTQSERHNDQYSPLAKSHDKNVCRVRDLPPPKLITEQWDIFGLTSEALPHEQQYYDSPYALVTPDGDWHARGKMGWFGCSDDNDTRLGWSQRYFEILSVHKDCMAVCIDCHI